MSTTHQPTGPTSTDSPKPGIGRRLEIVRLRDIDKLKWDEIAARMGVSRSTVIAQYNQYRFDRRTISAASTLSAADFDTIRALVAKYSLRTIILEVSRIAGNYGSTSPMWARIAGKIRSSVSEVALNQVR